MTLEEFKNLKVGDEIVFKSVLFKINGHTNYQDITTINATSISGSSVYIVHDRISLSISGIFVFEQTKILYKEPLTSISICLNTKSEKELIQEQIKTLQDKLIEIEKNDVENVIKNLVIGQFVEVTHKDFSKTYIYEFRNVNSTNLTLYNHSSGKLWEISKQHISKIIVRNDITEAYDKFQSLLKTIP